MADPLSLLRQYNINKKEIIESNNQIIFGELSWPKNVKTNYYITLGPRKEGNVREYYTLECLLFILKNSDLIHPEYVKRATAANIPAVRRPDRKKVLAYLNGEIDAICASIDKNAPLEVPTQVKRTHANEDDDSVPKKPRIETQYVLKDKELAACLDAPEEASVAIDSIN